MKADDLERELNSDPIAGEARDSAAAKEAIEPTPRPVEVVVVAPPVRTAPEVWEEAAVLRRLLFSANQPVVVAPSSLAQSGAGQTALASTPAQATNPPRNNNGGRRRRRRR